MRVGGEGEVMLGGLGSVGDGTSRINKVGAQMLDPRLCDMTVHLYKSGVSDYPWAVATNVMYWYVLSGYNSDGRRRIVARRSMSRSW